METSFVTPGKYQLETIKKFQDNIDLDLIVLIVSNLKF